MNKNILVSCISATTKTIPRDTPNFHSIAFTEANLIKICKDINSDRRIPITVNFDNNRITGEVIYGEVINMQLKIIAKISIEIPSCYIVPGFKVLAAEIGKEMLSYNDIELMNMGTTFSPMDESVTNFQIVKW